MKKYLIAIVLFCFSVSVLASDNKNELPRYFNVKNINGQSAISLNDIDFNVPGLILFKDLKNKKDCKYIGEFTKQGYIHISKEVCNNFDKQITKNIDLFAFEKEPIKNRVHYRVSAGSDFFIVKPENIKKREPKFYEKVLDNEK